MSRKCALLFLLFYTSVCFENDVVPLEFEDSGKENIFLESDNNVIVLPEPKENSMEELYEVGNSVEGFGQPEKGFQTSMNGRMQKTVKRYHCSVEGLGFTQNHGTFRFFLYLYKLLQERNIEKMFTPKTYTKRTIIYVR